MTPDTMQDLINWLVSHEDDIEFHLNDFGDLEQVFYECVGRRAGATITVKSVW